MPLESALPVRAFFSWPGKRTYGGLVVVEHDAWPCGLRELLERDFLMLADHDTAVEKNPSRTPAGNHSGAPLEPVWTIWGK